MSGCLSHIPLPKVDGGGARNSRGEGWGTPAERLGTGVYWASNMWHPLYSALEWDGVGSLSQMRKQKLSKLTQLTLALHSGPLVKLYLALSMSNSRVYVLPPGSSEEHRDAVPGVCHQSARVQTSNYLLLMRLFPLNLLDWSSKSSTKKNLLISCVTINKEGKLLHWAQDSVSTGDYREH